MKGPEVPMKYPTEKSMKWPRSPMKYPIEKSDERARGYNEIS